MVETIHALTVQRGAWQDTTRLVDKLNRALRGWANYFDLARSHGRIALSTTTPRCGYAGGCVSSTRSGDEGAGPIHSRTCTAILAWYAWPRAGAASRGRRREALSESRMREICTSGSMSGMWKRSQGCASEAPPDERGGNRYAQPTATAPHLDSTRSPTGKAHSAKPVGTAAASSGMDSVRNADIGEAVLLNPRRAPASGGRKSRAGLSATSDRVAWRAQPSSRGAGRGRFACIVVGEAANARLVFDAFFRGHQLPAPGVQLAGAPRATGTPNRGAEEQKCSDQEIS